jgi:trehalose 6-phosphate phosphatase
MPVLMLSIGIGVARASSMPLLSHDVDSLVQASRRPNDVLLFATSFDGVLAPYESDPSHVAIAPSRLALLKRLQGLPDVVVAIVSGRRLDDLRPRIPLDAGAFYIGLHGLEIAGPGFEWTCTEGIDAYRDCMRDVAVRLRATVSSVHGVRVECKGPIVALHTRDVAEQQVVWSRFQLLSAAADLVNTSAVRPLRGHDVLELLPNVDCSRSEALRTVRRCVEERHQRPVFTMYIAEDVPHDGALDAAGENGVGAVVGRRTHAAYHLESCDDVDEMMNELIADRFLRTSSNQ